MAYTFDKLQSQMDPDEASKQDIFAAEGMQGFSLTGDQPQGQVQPGAELKTQDSGAIGPVTTSSSNVQAAPSVPAKSSAPRGATEQRQATLDKQKTQFPRGLASLGESLAGKEKSLQESSDAYLEGFRQQDFGLDEATSEKALTGDQDALGKVSGLLNPSAPGNLDPYKPTDTSTPFIDQIQTEGGLENYLKRQAGPQYTTGEAGFDMSALTRDAGFQEGRSELARRAEALRDQEYDLTGRLPGEAADIVSGKRADAAQSLRDYYGGEQTEITDAIRALLAERQGALPGEIQTQLDTQSQAVLEALIAENPELEQYLGRHRPFVTGVGGAGTPSKISARDFADINPDALTSAQVTSADQANRFNAIMDLLGSGGEGADYLYADETPAGFRGFDEAGYRDALLREAMGLRDAQVTEPVPPVPPAPVPPAPVPPAPVPVPDDVRYDTGTDDATPDVPPPTSWVDLETGEVVSPAGVTPPPTQTGNLNIDIPQQPVRTDAPGLDDLAPAPPPDTGILGGYTGGLNLPSDPVVPEGYTGVQPTGSVTHTRGFRGPPPAVAPTPAVTEQVQPTGSVTHTRGFRGPPPAAAPPPPPPDVPPSTLEQPAYTYDQLMEIFGPGIFR